LRSPTFDLEEKRIKEEIKRRHADKVLIQLPEGLKTKATRLAEVVEETGALAIISADPCYGACDIAVREAEDLGADLVVHFGHSPKHGIPRLRRVKVIYIEARASLRVDVVVEKALPLLKTYKRIGLATTVQHVDRLDEIREILEKAGKSVAIGNAGRLGYAGQVIGCDYGNAQAVAGKVDVFLFIGGGRFHAIGVALSTSKPTLIADPYETRVYSVDSDADRIRKQRWASLQEAMRAERFGVLIGLKPGQKRFEEASLISGKLKKKGKKSYLLAVREITPEILLGFPAIDAYVNTACQRISLDDASRFHKPVLTEKEALVVVGEITWEQLLKKGWFED
jgi:2-(3-amino-3-carboxypropyl)histidine synthase